MCARRPRHFETQLIATRASITLGGLTRNNAFITFHDDRCRKKAVAVTKDFVDFRSRQNTYYEFLLLLLEDVVNETFA